MMGALRMCTLSVPIFREGGLDLNTVWQPVELDTPKKRAAVMSFFGRFVQIHPNDIPMLGEHGLAVVSGKLVEAKSAEAIAAPTDEPKAEKKPAPKKQL